MSTEFKELKKSKDRSFDKMPRWMDCSWKRIPCGKKSCKICGPFASPSPNVESSLDDIEKDTQRTPHFAAPENFPLVIQLNDWRTNVFGLIRQSYLLEKGWRESEAVADATWYSNILCSKVYLQHLNRRELKKSKQPARADYDYTQSVIKTCQRILRKAVALIYIFDYEHRDCWLALQKELIDFERRVLEV